MSKYIHFSGTKVKAIYSQEQGDEPHFKPYGFWFSDESDFGWSEWCKGEDFHLGNLKYQSQITISDKANILYIRNGKQLEKFTKDYQKLPSGMKEAYEKSGFGLELGSMWIDWKKVAKKYQGIVITPYLWKYRMDINIEWYYPWDCASGCIWDKDAIESIKLLSSVKLREKELA